MSSQPVRAMVLLGNSNHSNHEVEVLSAQVLNLETKLYISRQGTARCSQ